MTILRLDTEYDYDFDLYGLISVGKDYTLAWWLNKLFNFHLTKQQDLRYLSGGKDQLLISNYKFCLEQKAVRLFRNKALVTNNLIKPFLLPDIKEYDFILQITGVFTELYPKELINKLNIIPFVQYVKQFDPLSLKFKENLIF